MKRPQKITYLILLFLGFITFCIGIYGLFYGEEYAGKLLNISSSIVALSALLQLYISSYFSNALEKFLDVKKYPYGPPSYFTRETIDNPDKPFGSLIRSIIYFDTFTGAYILATMSIVIQLFASIVG